MTLNSLRQRFTIDESGEARYAIHEWIWLTCKFCKPISPHVDRKLTVSQ
ncbi:MAG: hypothetical protein ACTS4T_01895 [Candidatus Hodgkinia cicadicola]